MIITMNLLYKPILYILCNACQKKEGSLCGLGLNMLDCNIMISKFELQLCYCIPIQTNTLGKGINPLNLPPKR